MEPTRRDFTLLSLTALAATVCTSCSSAVEEGSAPLKVARGPVDIGPAANYANDGVYSDFAKRGFFIIRRGQELFALSSVCTHRKCIIDAAGDGTFSCPCHGAQYDKDGHVTEDPAPRDLPHYPITPTPNGRLVVNLS